ncbi:hypothetical protein [Streptomyces sp. NPDC002767]
MPCTCGRGYVGIVLDAEEILMELFVELAPTHGRSMHSVTPVDCASVEAVGAWR